MYKIKNYSWTQSYLFTHICTYLQNVYKKWKKKQVGAHWRTKCIRYQLWGCLLITVQLFTTFIREWNKYPWYIYLQMPNKRLESLFVNPFFPSNDSELSTVFSNCKVYSYLFCVRISLFLTGNYFIC